MDINVIASISLSLFLLMDPIGNIPIFISVLKKVKPSRQKFIIFRELIIALIVIIFFNFLGEYLLDLLKVSQPTIQIAGGIILFLISLKMIFPPIRGANHVEEENHEPFIVPLAIPFVAGPAVLAAVMLMHRSTPTSIMLISIFVAWVATTIILISSSFLQKLLGSRGITACERLMGLILILIAAQMFLEGLVLFLNR